MLRTLTISTRARGLTDITALVARVISDAALAEGVCTVFIRHTSASLVIQENADPSVQRDLESWFDRHVPEDLSLYTHRQEGPDDMPAHIKAALTATCLSIPVSAGRLTLGTWQGIYVWEHRRSPHTREVVVHVA